MTGDSRTECAQLATRIRDALAQAEGELGIQVTAESGVVTLRGVVQNEERRERLSSLSRAMSPGFAVANQITVCAPDSPAPAETLP